MFLQFKRASENIAPLVQNCIISTCLAGQVWFETFLYPCTCALGLWQITVQVTTHIATRSEYHQKKYTQGFIPN